MTSMIVTHKGYWDEHGGPKVGEKRTQGLYATPNGDTFFPKGSVMAEVIEVESGCLRTSKYGNDRYWTWKERFSFPEGTLKIIDDRYQKDYLVETDETTQLKKEVIA